MSDENHYTIVVKLGSSSIIDEHSREPRIANMASLVETLVKLRKQGHKIVFVTSGAIAVGMRKMKMVSKPKKLAIKQALAAVGQGELISMWDELFTHLNQTTAQVLLTRNDIIHYSQFENAENTLKELLDMNIIPIVNENDTISAQEIKFGDNDTLSAITAGMCNADFLFLLTDVDCLYTDNPRTNKDAKPVVLVKNMNSLEVNTKSSGSSIGTGGMKTKLTAADLATNAGVTTVICNSKRPQNILKIVKYSHKEDRLLRNSKDILPREDSEQFSETNKNEFQSLKVKHVPLHTRFIGQPKYTIKNKQFWMLHGLKPNGAIIVDIGCCEAITRHNRAGMLPAGVIGVEGEFHRMECVEIKLGFRKEHGEWDKSKEAVTIGKGRPNYASSEVYKIKGLQSSQISKFVDPPYSESVILRDNMAFPVHPDSALLDAMTRARDMRKLYSD